jgi:2-polyprenyl-3-methyl-5-hydroxy-6-metoxy-1,4-benzoquinol methylase
MKDNDNIAGYCYSDAELNHSHGYLLPVVIILLEGLQLSKEQRRIFELGCGNGSVAHYLTKNGWEVTGIDPSTEGISLANQHYPRLRLLQSSASDDLSGKFGRFPVVVSLEVVEHVYAPREYARALFNLCDKGGTVIVSTPFHGYFKNLAMALLGKMDNHFTALWDNGHIKFWSMKTLSALLEETGFNDIRFRRTGRIPAFAKSMIAIAKRP